jgi:hypothetical protein
MWSSFISTGVWMAISVVFWAISASCCNDLEKKNVARTQDVHTLSHTYRTPSSSLLPPPLSLSSIVLSSLFAMPKKDPRDEAGTIVLGWKCRRHVGDMSATCRRHANMSPIFAPTCQFQRHVSLVSEHFCVVIFPTLTYQRQMI